MKKLTKFLLKIKIVPLLSLIIVLFSCSASQTSKDASIEINDISVAAAENRVPKENSSQVNLELNGIMNENNTNQDVEYSWFVEYLKLDIANDKGISFTSENNTTIGKLEKTSSNFFIEISSSNHLNALLSVYNEGYYRVTLQASKTDEIREKSVIIKIGDPALPHLFIKNNIPDVKESVKNDFKGRYYLKYNNNITKLDAGQIKDDWYDTNIEINPFLSFNIEILTHLIADENSKPQELKNDNLKYQINGEENIISINPIVLENIENGKLQISKNKDIVWKEGNFYISFLIWKEGDSSSDRFQHVERIINESNKNIFINLNNVYLAKIFTGSFGLKNENSSYFIYFGPEGTNMNELDPNNLRDIPSLPFGYLLGRLGENGNTFALGSSFSYSAKELEQILSF